MKKSPPFVSLITVNYNGKHYLNDCLESALSINYPKEKREVILVDNGSSDGSVEFAQKNFPEVKIIRNDVNNYCRANNLGISRAKGELVALINNDLKLHKQWLAELTKVMMSDENIGAATGKILFYDGILQGAGHYAFPNFYWADRGFREIDKGQYDLMEEVTSISHCAALYRKKCLEKTGLLDEDFNMYLEDVDMSLRIKTSGWRLFYVPSSIVHHKYHGSVDEGKVDLYCQKNRLLLIAKHYPQELTLALCGNGYFTALNNKNELLKVLPAVFSKLIKHHPKEKVQELLPGLFNELDKIFNEGKDQLIKQLGDLKDSCADLQQNIIPQKDLLIQRKEIEASGFKEKISRSSEIIAAKEEEIAQKEAEIFTLKESIRQSTRLIADKERELAEKQSALQLNEGLLQQKDAEILQLKDKLDCVYNSETYRFIIRPVLWPVLNAMKLIFKFPLKSAGVFKAALKPKPPDENKKDICLAQFSAPSIYAQRDNSNIYCIKATNNSACREKVKIGIDIYRNEYVVHPQGHYAYFFIEVYLEPKETFLAEVDYDWRDKAVFYSLGKPLELYDFWRGPTDKEGVYSLQAIIYDSENKILNAAEIFQRLK